MKISVWDTYVTRDDSSIMHFDILVPDSVQDSEKVFEYGRAYLKRKSVVSEDISSEVCKFCHIEEASETVTEEVKKHGFYVVELKNCGV